MDAGVYTGQFFQEVLAVNIPVASEAKMAYYKPASSFWRRRWKKPLNDNKWQQTERELVKHINSLR